MRTLPLYSPQIQLHTQFQRTKSYVPRPQSHLLIDSFFYKKKRDQLQSLYSIRPIWYKKSLDKVKPMYKYIITYNLVKFNQFINQKERNRSFSPRGKRDTPFLFCLTAQYKLAFLVFNGAIRRVLQVATPTIPLQLIRIWT